MNRMEASAHLPLGLRHRAALGTTFQGPGRSRKIASTAPSCTSKGKPLVMMSRWVTVTTGPRPWASSSLRASSGDLRGCEGMGGDGRGWEDGRMDGRMDGALGVWGQRQRG